MSRQAGRNFAQIQLYRLVGLSDRQAKGNILGTGQGKKQQGGGGGWKKFCPGSLIGVFELPNLQKRRSWGKFDPGSSRHQNMYTFFAILGGLEEISPESWLIGK